MLPCPLTPLLVAKIAGLKTAVGLLLILLIKSQLLRVKMSFIGTMIALVLTLSYIAASGVMAVAAAGSITWGLQQRRNAAT